MTTERCCCVCGSASWMAAALTEPPRVWCLEHWRQSWVSVPGRAEDESGAVGQIDWLLLDAVTVRRTAAELALRTESIAE